MRLRASEGLRRKEGRQFALTRRPAGKRSAAGDTLDSNAAPQGGCRYDIPVSA